MLQSLKNCFLATGQCNAHLGEDEDEATICSGRGDNLLIDKWKILIRDAPQKTRSVSVTNVAPLTARHPVEAHSPLLNIFNIPWWSVVCE